MPSIRDVAKQAGCSTSTVSRVINKRDSVDPDTRQKVLDAIAFLGYKPNLVAQGLRVKRGNLIGLVLPDESESFSQIAFAASEQARKHGYNLIFGCVKNDPSIEAQLLDDFIRRHINGIIFSRVSDESKVLHKVTRKEVPIVIIDRTFAHEEIPTVVLDNYQTGIIVAEHFIKLKHTKIACVTGPLKIELARERLNGFLERLSNSNISVPDSWIFEGDFYFESGLKAVDYFISNKIQPTAIWALNDNMAWGILKRLYQRGIAVPETVSVIGMDDLQFSRMVTPSLTTISYPFRKMAEEAVDMIVAMQEGKRLEEQSLKLIPKLIVRESSSTLSKGDFAR